MHPRCVALMSSLAVIACSGESVPTAPVDAGSARFAEVAPFARPEPLAQVRKLQLASRSLVLDGTPVPYTLKLRNASGASMQEVWYQIIIEQGENYRGGGGSNAICGGASAELPVGTCEMDATTSVDNSLPGEGTMVPGPAEVVLTLSRGFTTPEVQDVARVRVTLVAP